MHGRTNYAQQINAVCANLLAKILVILK